MPLVRYGFSPHADMANTGVISSIRDRINEIENQRDLTPINTFFRLYVNNVSGCTKCCSNWSQAYVKQKSCSGSSLPSQRKISDPISFQQKPKCHFGFGKLFSSNKVFSCRNFWKLKPLFARECVHLRQTTSLSTPCKLSPTACTLAQSSLTNICWTLASSKLSLDCMSSLVGVVLAWQHNYEEAERADTFTHCMHVYVPARGGRCL